MKTRRLVAGSLCAAVVLVAGSGRTTAQTTAPTAARANSYDDAWQDGPTGWVANAKAILAGGSQTQGLVLWIGDSLTRDPALGAWAQRGAGKTTEDQAITAWMNAGLSPQSLDSIDGFALATPYICPARSFTVGDGLGSWDFMGGSMPADTSRTTARQKLLDCAKYPNALNLTTILTAISAPQFAIPEVNLDAARPGVFPDFERMVDLMISRHIVPIIITYTYRTDNAFNLLVDKYNVALVQYAKTKKLPLIDLNNEMLLRLPFSQWPGRFLSDGVHYTRGNTQYPSTASPYANGGDPATHTTGAALTYNGYGLKGWLGVQKMKEIKQLVLDGGTPVPVAPAVSLGASPASIAGGQSATLTWTATNATAVTINQGIGTVASSGTRSVSPTATTTYTVTATNTAGSATANATVTVTAPAPVPQPQLAVSHPALYFGARGTGVLTPAQTEAVSITNAGTATIDWTVAADQPWLTVSAGGRGNGTFTVSVKPGTYALGLYQGQVTVSSPGLQSRVIQVSLTSYASTDPPAGSFDTPAQNAVNITGSMPVTGWALHQVGVSKVDVYRDAVSGEAAPGTLVFVGTAVFVDGARPDLEAASTLPFNYRAGWGLMVLSNVLPNQGNGTYTFQAIATGLDGSTTTLGRRAVSCANAGATVPFGAIDTPGQGETVSGTIMNWGWALAPMPYSINPDGSGLEVYVDGTYLGHPVYGFSRADIVSAFPGFANTNGAVGYFVIDTRRLANGVHTIGWIVRDQNGHAEGIGSRFFNVQNTGASLTAAIASPPPANGMAARETSRVTVRRGFDPGAPPEDLPARGDGSRVVSTVELDRVELELGQAGPDARFEGALRVGADLRELPAGSRLDAATGRFVWQPGVGFAGTYEFLFTRRSASGIDEILITIVIGPKHDGDATRP